MSASKDLFSAAQDLEKAQQLLEDGRPQDGLRALGLGVPPQFRAEHAHVRAECLRSMGSLGGCRPWYEKALAGTDRSRDTVLWLDSCLGLVSALRSLGECAKARRLLSQGMSLAKKQGLASHAERCRLEGILLDRAEGRYPRSIRELSGFLALFRRRKDLPAMAYILWALGGARRFSGDLSGSLKDYEDSLALAGKAKDPMGRGYAMLGLGGIERIKGNLSAALAWYLRSRKAFAKTQDLFAQAYAECGTGNCLRQLGRLKEARGCYAASHRLYTLIKDPVDLAYVDWGLGKIAMAEGRLDDAGRRLMTALSGFGRFEEHRGVVLSLMALAAVRHAQGRTTEGEKLFDQGLALARKTGLHTHLEIYT
ncbi:MAG: hypothetical protein HZB91_08245 [Elusimicrobia bacterium]|nr:hypothetical protein [Elusimicrobiota bacterium]